MEKVESPGSEQIAGTVEEAGTGTAEEIGTDVETGTVDSGW